MDRKKLFKKILYIVSYILAIILFVVGLFTFNFEVLGLAFLHLIIGIVFHAKYKFFIWRYYGEL